MRWQGALSAVLAAALATQQVACAPPTPASEEAQQEVKALFFNKAFVERALPDVCIDLQDAMGARDLTFEEWFDYGTAWLFQKRWDRAASAYEAAAAKSKDSSRKAGAYLLAAQSAEFGKRFQEAGQLANTAARFDPRNKQVAAMRSVFWRAAGDDLESLAAEDCVKQLDLRLDGTEVIEPFTAVVVLGGVVLAGVFTAVIVSNPTPEQLRDMIATWIEAFPWGAVLGATVLL